VQKTTEKSYYVTLEAGSFSSWTKFLLIDTW